MNFIGFRFIKGLFAFCMVTTFFLWSPAQTIQRKTSLEVQQVLMELDYASSVIIDGRDSAKFSKGHIKNAVCMDAFDLRTRYSLLPYLDNKLIVVYCTMNTRSEKIIELLQELKFEGIIINIIDGISGWQENNFPLENEL